MANRADEIVDRRRLRRKLTFWRVAAILIAATAIVVAALRLDGGLYSATQRDHIAQIRVEGTVTEDEELLERIAGLARNEAVKGVIVTVDSPGGTTAGGEAVFDAIRKLAEKKPVVAQVGTLAASAGYMIASAADHIVARKTSIIGSIGVLVQIPNVRVLLENIGVEVDTIKSAPLKAEPSPFNVTTEDERQMMRALVLDSFDWFVGLVTERRPLDEAQVRALADGSVFTGRQALGNKLVDELGGKDQAVAWLETKGVAKDLKVIEWKRTDNGGWLGNPVSWTRALAGLLGFGGQGIGFIEGYARDRIFLDGLLSIWQPAAGSENIE